MATSKVDIKQEYFKSGDTWEPYGNMPSGTGYMINGTARITIPLPKQVKANNVSVTGNIRIAYGSGITSSKSISSYSYTLTVRKENNALYLAITDLESKDSLTLVTGQLLSILFLNATFTFS